MTEPTLDIPSSLSPRPTTEVLDRLTGESFLDQADVAFRCGSGADVRMASEEDAPYLAASFLRNWSMQEGCRASGRPDPNFPRAHARTTGELT